MAGVVRTVRLLKVRWKTIDFPNPSHFWWPDVTQLARFARIFLKKISWDGASAFPRSLPSLHTCHSFTAPVAAAITSDIGCQVDSRWALPLISSYYFIFPQVLWSGCLTQYFICPLLAALAVIVCNVSYYNNFSVIIRCDFTDFSLVRFFITLYMPLCIINNKLLT